MNENPPNQTSSTQRRLEVPDKMSDANPDAALGGATACSFPQEGSQYPWNHSDPLPSGGPNLTDVPSSTVDPSIRPDNTSVPDWFVQFQADFFQKCECQFHEWAQHFNGLEERILHKTNNSKNYFTRCKNTTLASSEKAVHQLGCHTCRVVQQFTERLRHCRLSSTNGRYSWCKAETRLNTTTVCLRQVRTKGSMRRYHLPSSNCSAIAAPRKSGTTSTISNTNTWALNSLMGIHPNGRTGHTSSE